MDIDKQLVQQLTEIGFMAGGYGLLTESQRIVAGLKAIRPQSEFPFIVEAVTQLNANQAEAAMILLRDQALPLNPNSSMTKCFLGFACKRAGRGQESEQWLKQVVETNDDAEATALAQALLAEQI